MDNNLARMVGELAEGGQYACEFRTTKVSRLSLATVTDLACACIFFKVLMMWDERWENRTARFRGLLPDCHLKSRGKGRPKDAPVCSENSERQHQKTLFVNHTLSASSLILFRLPLALACSTV